MEKEGFGLNEIDLGTVLLTFHTLHKAGHISEWWNNGQGGRGGNASVTMEMEVLNEKEPPLWDLLTWVISWIWGWNSFHLLNPKIFKF